MKHKGSQSYYKEELEADLLRAYKEQLAISKGNISLPEVAKNIANSPSKRFWISEERALKVMYRMMHGDDLSDMKPTKRDMYQEIYRRFREYKQDHPSLTSKDIIFHVCNEPAPKFYYTPKSIIVLLHKVRKEEKRRCLEKIKSKLGFMFAMR